MAYSTTIGTLTFSQADDGMLQIMHNQTGQVIGAYSSPVQLRSLLQGVSDPTAALQAVYDNPNITPATIPGTGLPSTPENVGMLNDAYSQGFAPTYNEDGSFKAMENTAGEIYNPQPAQAGDQGTMFINGQQVNTPAPGTGTINGNPVGTPTTTAQPSTNAGQISGTPAVSGGQSPMTSTSGGGFPNFNPVINTAAPTDPTRTAVLQPSSSVPSAALQLQTQLYPQIEQQIDEATAGARQDILTGSEGAYDALMNNYLQGNAELQPYAEAGRLGLTNYQDLVGVNGADKQAAAISQVKNMPGYQFTMDEALRAVERQASVLGNTESTTLQSNLAREGAGIFGNFYQQQLQNLQPLIQGGQQAATNRASISQGLGSALAGLSQQTGQDLASIGLQQAGGKTSALGNIASNITALYGATPANQAPTINIGSNALSSALRGLI